MRPIREMLFEDDPYSAVTADQAAFDPQGWGHENPVLLQAVSELKPRLIVEVGSWKGASAIAMARERARLGADFELVCVDTWLGAPEFWLDKGDADRYKSLKIRNGYPSVYFTFLNNILCEGLQDYVTPFPATSFEAHTVFRKRGVKADMVYIDAAHEYQEVAADIEGWFKVLRKGGLMIGDDYVSVWPGVIRAVEEAADRIPGFDKVGIFGDKWVARKA